MAKYNFKILIDKVREDNEFLTENLVFIEVKDFTPEQFATLLNTTLGSKEKIVKPKFELFDPSVKESE
jgi:hypothetical protein